MDWNVTIIPHLQRKEMKDEIAAWILLAARLYCRDDCCAVGNEVFVSRYMK